MRRRWKEWSAAGSGVNGSGSPALAAAAGEPSYQVRHGCSLYQCWGVATLGPAVCCSRGCSVGVAQVLGDKGAQQQFHY